MYECMYVARSNAKESMPLIYSDSIRVSKSYFLLRVQRLDRISLTTSSTTQATQHVCPPGSSLQPLQNHLLIATQPIYPQIPSIHPFKPSFVPVSKFPKSTNYNTNSRSSVVAPVLGSRLLYLGTSISSPSSRNPQFLTQVDRPSYVPLPLSELKKSASKYLVLTFIDAHALSNTHSKSWTKSCISPVPKAVYS